MSRSPFFPWRRFRGCPVSDFDRVFLRKAPFVPARDEHLDDPETDETPEDGAAPEGGAAPAGREGLPPTFRMRARFALRRPARVPRPRRRRST